MLAGYLLIMTALGAGLRLLAQSKTSGPRAGSRAAERPDGTPPAAGPRRGWLALARHLASTAVAGYLLLMAVVIV